MAEWKITYEQLLELNYLIRKVGETFQWMVSQRTVQESKLFPLPAINALCFLNSYYRYPDLLRKAARTVTPEACGDRAREVCCKLSILQFYCCFGTYLLGREFLIRVGLLRPEDNLEDLWFTLHWMKRATLAYQRQNAHLFNYEANHTQELLPERVLQVFEADLHPVREGSQLKAALKRFLPTLSRYSFPAHNESRIGLNNHGPYRLGGNLKLFVRDYADLAEGDLPWLDGVAEKVPYNNLSVALAVRDTQVEVVDIGTLYTDPADFMGRIVGVGLYTSDFLSEGYLPVGMESEGALTEALQEITQRVNEATVKLWKRVAAMNWDQRVDAGLFSHTHMLADFLHIAGAYHQEDWLFADERVERFRLMFNDQGARETVREIMADGSHRHGTQSEYHINPITKTRGQSFSLVPASVLIDHDYPRRVNALGLSSCVGTTSIPAKSTRYTFASGKYTEEEMNARARAFLPRVLQEPWRYLDDPWARSHADTPQAQELYRLSQAASRNLRGRGAGLLREDLRRIRREKGEAEI